MVLLSTYFSNIIIRPCYKLGRWVHMFDTRNTPGFRGTDDTSEVELGIFALGENVTPHHKPLIKYSSQKRFFNT
jgi:hypothetical protein